MKCNAFCLGISYLNNTDEQKLQDKLAEKHELLELQMTSPTFTSPTGHDTQMPSKGPIQIPDEHKEFIEEIRLIVLFQKKIGRSRTGTFKFKLYYSTPLRPFKCLINSTFLVPK